MKRRRPRYYGVFKHDDSQKSPDGRLMFFAPTGLGDPTTAIAEMRKGLNDLMASYRSRRWTDDEIRENCDGQIIESLLDLTDELDGMVAENERQLADVRPAHPLTIEDIDEAARRLAGEPAEVRRGRIKKLLRHVEDVVKERTGKAPEPVRVKLVNARLKPRGQTLNDLLPM